MGTVNFCFYLIVWVLVCSRGIVLVARGNGFYRDSCSRGIALVCQIWLLLVVLVVFANFRVVSGKSNFAFMIVIVELHLGRELIFGRVNLVPMWKSLFLLGENGFCFGEVAILVGGIVILISR